MIAGRDAEVTSLSGGDEELLPPFEVLHDPLGGLLAATLEDGVGDGLVLAPAVGDALGILVLDSEDDAVQLAAEPLHDLEDLPVSGELAEHQVEFGVELRRLGVVAL